MPADRLDLTLASGRGRWVLVATILGSAVAGIDATVVAIALPAIGRDLETSFTGVQWTVTAYTLTLASFILLSGGAGDRYGRRRLFVIGVVSFAVASVACALAPTIGVLVAARALQGVGGALLTPASLAIIEASFRERDRGAAIGLWAGFSGAAAAIAPFVGGWLLAVATWRWVFLINLPLAALVAVIATRYVPESHADDADGRLDWLGSALTVVFLGCGTLALIELRSGQPVLVGAAAVASVLGLAAFVWRELRAPHPILPLGLFRVRQFTATNAVTLLLYGAMAPVFFLLVLQLQIVSGWSPLAAGAATVPTTILLLALSRRSGALAARIGPRLQMSVGPLLCAVGTILAMRIDDADPLVPVLLAMIVFGLGLATFVAPLTATALNSAPTSRAGIASGVNNAVARTAALLAIAAIPVLAGLAGNALEDPVAFSAGFDRALLICAVVFVGGGVLAWATIRRPDSDRRREVDEMA